MNKKKIEKLENAATVSLNKILLLENKIIDHDKYIKELQFNIWKLQNPFKFNIGDLVKIESTENKKEYDKTFKVISREIKEINLKNYVKNNIIYMNIYNLFCCETDELIEEQHEHLLILIKNKKGIKNETN